MLHLRDRRPSPAMIVACVALVFSLAGNAIAARVLITSSTQIKNGTVTGADVRNSSLRGADVRNGSLAAADLSTAARRTLRSAAGAVGPAGPAGPQGPAGAVGPQGPAGPIEGTPAGGSLSGTYPSPGLATGAVTSAALAASAVTAAKLANGAVTNAKLANDAVNADKLATNAVTADAIGANAVGDSELSYAYLPRQTFIPFGNDIANGSCTQFSEVLVDFLFNLPAGSMSLPFEVAGEPGWAAEGAPSTADDRVRMRLCNHTGATADPPPSVRVNILALRP